MGLGGKVGYCKISILAARIRLPPGVNHIEKKSNLYIFASLLNIPTILFAARLMMILKMNFPTKRSSNSVCYSLKSAKKH